MSSAIAAAVAGSAAANLCVAGGVGGVDANAVAVAAVAGAVLEKLLLEMLWRHV